MFFCSAYASEEWVMMKNNVNIITPAPKLKFPHQIGVLRAKINNPEHPYLSTGYFFEKGKIFDEDDLSAQDYSQKEVHVQMKPMNHYKDGSIRFALLTFKFNSPSLGHLYKIALLNKIAQKRNYNKVSLTLPHLQIKISTGQNKSKTISLKDKASMEKNLWLKGPFRYEKRYFIPISKDLIAQFDVSFFDNGHKKIELALKHTAPEAVENLHYKAEFFYNGALIKNVPLSLHPAHTIKHYSFHFGYKERNHAILDAGALIKLGVFPAFDIHSGVNPNANFTDITNNQSIISQYDANYLMLQTEDAKQTMLQYAHKAFQKPIFLTDRQSQKPLSQKDFYKVKKKSNKIYPITAYVPFITTGERQYYDQIKAYFIYNRLKAFQSAQKGNIDFDIKDYIQIRKSSAFLNSIANHNDTYLNLKNYLDKDWSFLETTLMNYKNIGKTPYSLGALRGVLPFQHQKDIDFLNIKNQDLLGLVTAFEANLNISPSLRNFSNWQVQFLSERFLQKENIFNPIYGFASYYKIKDQSKYFQKWEDIALGSYKTQPFKTIKKAFSEEKLPYDMRYHMLLAAATNAQIFNVTHNIKALEAYGAIMRYFSKIKQDMLNQPHLRITPIIQNAPLKKSHIFTGNKSHIFTGNKWNDNLSISQGNSLIYGGAGNDILSVKSGSAYMFGGRGNDKIIAGSSRSILFGGDGKDILVAGPDNDILQGDGKNKNYADIFQFKGPVIGQNTIIDFTPGVDKIHIFPSLNIAQYQYSNRLEGLSFDRRRGGKGRNPECDKLPKEEQDKREDCLKYRRYYNAGLVDFEYIKELSPNVPAFIDQEKKRLKKSLAFLKSDTESKRYKRDKFEYETILKQEKLLLKEEKTRQELLKISETANIGAYRQKENELKNILATKKIIINNILAASRFGDKAATKLLNPKPITNIGLRNYFRPAAGSSTIIDFNINVTPEEHLKNSNDPISNRIGSILIKGIPPEKLTRDNFIFGN